METNINPQRLQDFLIKLLRIPSPSGQESEVADFLLSTFAKYGAIKDEIGNVFFKIAGEGEPLLLDAHMDVVSPCTELEPVVVDGWLSNAKPNVLGLDDKAGIACIYELINSLPPKHRPLEILFTIEEETTINGVKKFDLSKLKAKEGLAIDLAAPVGSYVTESPSAYQLNWRVSGTSAHTKFLSPDAEYAWSAMREIVGRSDFGALPNRTNVNWAKLDGGSGRNVITGDFELKGEMRSFDPSGAAAFLKSQAELEQDLRAKFKTLKIERDAVHEHEGYLLPADSAIQTKFRNACEASSIKPDGILSFGLSEANEWRRMGLDVIDVGYGAIDTHTPRERMLVADLEKVVKVLHKLVST